MENEKKTEKEEEFRNSYAVIKHLTTVHSNKPTKTGLSEDLILSKLTTSDKQSKTEAFIIDQYKVARALKDFVAHKETGNEIFKDLMSEINMMVLLKRNDPSNFIVKELIKGQSKEEGEEIEETQKQGFLKKLISKPKEKEVD